MPWLIIPLALLALLLYWELIIVEGAHLGPKVVVWLYDIAAPRYERIKQFNWETEAALVGWPLVETLAHTTAPRVLDVGAGTGRVARVLLPNIAFDGCVINLDLSLPMLQHGQIYCVAWPTRAGWAQAPADTLPFADEVFEAVTCLEALEFFPSAREALAECVRVLRPGGVLLLSNRIGWPARLMPGKTFSRAALLHMLHTFPLTDIRRQPWQVEYDLVWAVKRGKWPVTDLGFRVTHGMIKLASILPFSTPLLFYA
jgi:ubiquinone/menaquinone biosynthesis C-methylase UbiE